MTELPLRRENMEGMLAAGCSTDRQADSKRRTMQRWMGGGNRDGGPEGVDVGKEVCKADGEHDQRVAHVAIIAKSK